MKSYFTKGLKKLSAYSEARRWESPKTGVKAVNSPFWGDFAFLDHLTMSASSPYVSEYFEWYFLFLTESEFEAVKKWPENQKRRYIKMRILSIDFL